MNRHLTMPRLFVLGHIWLISTYVYTRHFRHGGNLDLQLFGVHWRRTAILLIVSISFNVLGLSYRLFHRYSGRQLDRSLSLLHFALTSAGAAALLPLVFGWAGYPALLCAAILYMAGLAVFGLNLLRAVRSKAV